MTTLHAGQAVRFDRFGDETVLELVQQPAPSVDADHAVIEVRAASINPSDTKNVAGRMAQTKPPRIPGRDFAGVVVAGPEAWLGTSVWGTGGDVGFTRDGTHARYLHVPVAALSRKPDALDFIEAGAVGVNFVTAWLAIMERGKIQPGETALITGANGGVGSAAVQIAKWQGAKVLAAVRGMPQSDSPILHAADHFIDIQSQSLSEAVSSVTNGKGADLAFDTVGGVLFEPTLVALRQGGRMVCIAATGDRRTSFDLIDFYRAELSVHGVDSLKRKVVDCVPIMNALHRGFAEGALKAPHIAAALPLQQARAAYARVARGERGRIVLLPIAAL